MLEEYMIFIIVGQEKFCFNRLLKIIDDGIRDKIIQDDVFAQIGNSNYIPSQYAYEKFLPFEMVINKIKSSKIIVTHAGVGSTLVCFSLGKFPILFPRYNLFKEHIDDHQVEFANRMEQEKLVLVAHDKQELLNKIQNYDKLIQEIKHRERAVESNGLIRYLNKVIEG